MGMPASPWDDEVFAFSGDVVGGQVSTVVWDDRLFAHASNNVIIVGSATMIEVLRSSHNGGSCTISSRRPSDV